jgi:hypothetical protein
VGEGAIEPTRREAGGQIIPSKTKQNRLDLLGFIRPNQAFSKGYGESK